MTFVAGTPLSASDLNDALGADSPTTFTTTTPVGTGWYRFLMGGEEVEFHFLSTGNVSSATTVTLDFTIPATYRPAEKTAIGAASSTTTKLGACVIDDAGVITYYNGHSSSAVAYAHGKYKPA